MAQAQWQSDQPTNLNYLSPVNFDLQINKLPKTRYFATGVTLPGVNFSEALHTNTLAINSYLPGDKIEFDPLVVKFVVDEDMTNYIEIFNWIIVDSKKTPKGGFSSASFENMYSDATLIVNTSSNNANIEYMFEDTFPTGLSGVEFASDAQGVEYAVSELTLRYTQFKVKTST